MLSIHTLCASFLCAFTAIAPQSAPRAQAQAQPVFDQNHAVWSAVLKTHVKGDRFDYKALSEMRGKLDEYLGMLQAVTRDEFEHWTKEQRLAFWLNAYNAYTIHLVAKSYPLESIKDISGAFKSVWDKPFIPLGHLFPGEARKELTLNNIEHDILRPTFKDARIHAAVNCASRSCPPLRNEAFVAERIGAQLDEQVRAWLADPIRNRFDHDKNRVQISEIFSWFHDDFERDAKSVQQWIARYAPVKDASWLKSAEKLDISYLDYSWKLNDIEREKR